MAESDSALTPELGKGLTSALDHNDADIFAKSLTDQVNVDDTHAMVFVQRDMLSRFEKTNEMLINFNLLSTARYEVTVKEFQKHTQLLYDMKKDLDGVFKRIRLMKQRLSKTYPEAFAACSSVYNLSEDDDDSDDEQIVPVPSEVADTREMSTSTTELKPGSSLVTTIASPTHPKVEETGMLVDLSDS